MLLAGKFILGTIIASFIQCLVWRQVNHVSQFIARSFCDTCHHSLAFWQLIPIIGVALQKGRCHFCQHKLSLAPPLFELFGGFFASRYLTLNLYAGLLFSLGLWLAALAWFDLLTLSVPNILLLLGLIFCLSLRFLKPALTPFDLGIMLCLCLILVIFNWRHWLGVGDTLVLLGLMLAFGWYCTCLILFLATLGCLVFNIFAKVAKLPFIPFLTLTYLGLAYVFPPLFGV